MPSQEEIENANKYLTEYRSKLIQCNFEKELKKITSDLLNIEYDKIKEIIWYLLDEIFAQDEILGSYMVTLKPESKKYYKRIYFEKVCKNFNIDYTDKDLRLTSDDKILKKIFK